MRGVSARNPQAKLSIEESGIFSRVPKLEIEQISASFRLNIAQKGFFFDQLMLLFVDHISGEELPILTHLSGKGGIFLSQSQKRERKSAALWC